MLLDAAAFVPTNAFSLETVHPEFVALSFYKMFGYPTGVGCLLARKSALAKLHRPWFAGGTITVASVQGDRYYLHAGGEAFEDGTLNYLALPAVEIGLRHIASVGLETIHTRAQCLTGWLLDTLSALRHANAKFERRFRRMEALAAAEGMPLEQRSLEAQDALWDRTKAEERGG